MMKEKNNLIGREARLVTPNRKWLFQKLPSLHEYIHAQKLRYQSTLSHNIDDQRILQYDMRRGTTGHT